MRKILGFAALAVVAWVVLKLVFGLLGTIIGLGITILMAAFVGWVFYLIIRLFAPSLADRIAGTIRGRETGVPRGP